MDDVSEILRSARPGDPETQGRLFPLVYDELRRLAGHKLAGESPGHTLQPTALVHEAYLRLVGDQQFDNRGHFFAAAAEAMRRILVENARRRGRLKRGGDLNRVELNEDAHAASSPDEELLALDEALTLLADRDPEAARLVHLRYFAGLSIPRAAECMGVSPRSADRLWAYARAWLRQQVRGEGDPSDSQ